MSRAERGAALRCLSKSRHALRTDPDYSAAGFLRRRRATLRPARLTLRATFLPVLLTLRATFLARLLVFLAARLLAAIHQLQLWSESPGRSPGGAAGANPLMAAEGRDQRTLGSTAVVRIAAQGGNRLETSPDPHTGLVGYSTRRAWGTGRYRRDDESSHRSLPTDPFRHVA
jgi:hypothetical protein